MPLHKKDLQLQYQGFLQTPFLWHGKGVFGLQQFKTKQEKTTVFKQNVENNPRLGKLIERFVTHSLKQNNSIEILAENIQIQKDKITLGEFDCFLKQDNTPIHLEIVYKFYIYDTTVGSTEIEHWIGPNKRDSLLEKLTKLKKKQLPLLYNSTSKKYLNKLNLELENIQQQVYFKTQLFVPLSNFKQQFLYVNNNCIYGFYIKPTELNQFSNAKFYIPTKHNWLVKPHPNVKWNNFETFKTKLQNYMKEKNAPLCWLKQPNGTLLKFFIVWW